MAFDQQEHLMIRLRHTRFWDTKLKELGYCTWNDRMRWVRHQIKTHAMDRLYLIKRIEEIWGKMDRSSLGVFTVFYSISDFCSTKTKVQKKMYVVLLLQTVASYALTLLSTNISCFFLKKCDFRTIFLIFIHHSHAACIRHLANFSVIVVMTEK